MSKFETTLVSTGGAPPITVNFDGDTVRAELDGAKLYGEAEGDDRTRVRLTDAAGEVLADVTVHPRAHRNATENVTDVGCALLWSHWRYTQSLTNAAPSAACQPTTRTSMNNIRPEFQAHDVTPNQIERIQMVREGFSTLLDEIDQLVPAGRDRALVVTKLQEASMFAARGIAAPPPTVVAK